MAAGAEAVSPGLLGFPRKAVVAALLAVAIAEAAYLAVWLSRSSQPPFDDFFALWSFGKFALAAGPAVYHPLALQTFQRALDPGLAGSYPCPYPPTFLLALLPLGLLPLAPAYAIWIVGTFVLYVLATLGRDWRSLSGAALLVAPTTLLAVVSGQNGLLSAALLAGGLRNLGRSPVTAGILLGLLAYKPQFVLLMPVVLLAARAWRAIFAACLANAAAIIASSAAFGWSIWPEWLRGMPLYRELLQANQTGFYHLMPTVAAGMREVGAAAPATYAAQGLLAAILAVVLWRMAARGLDDRTIAAAMVATILATPYAFIYDTPMVTAALAIYGQWRQRRGAPIQAWHLAVVLLMFAVLVGMSRQALPFAAPVLMTLVFGAIVFGDGSQGAYPRAHASARPRVPP